MGVVTAPWSDLVLLLRYITDSSTGSIFPLLMSGFVLFVSVCLILLQLAMYFHWKLTQVDAELTNPQKSAIFRTNSGSADWRRRSSL